ncbi:MAG: hypothetical protein RIS26_28 [Actinomycetota bacterium]|jgi:hypothetical protein
MSNLSLDSRGAPEEFWFNLKTGQVEYGKKSAAIYRVGPFQTEEEAKNALQTLRDRAQKWHEEEED